MTGPASAPAATSIIAAPQPVFFPTAVAAPRRTDVGKPTPRSPGSASTDAASRGRLLWIDDQPELMAALAAYLIREGLDVEFAPTGAAGFRMASSAVYDIILLDLKLPDELGMDVLKRIRSADIRTPVIVISAYGSIESALEAGRAGAAGFKSKPLRAADLLHTIRSVIDSSKREEPARLFREAQGEGPAASVRQIIGHLSEITSLSDSRDVNGWSEVRDTLRKDLARAIADPHLTLVEFSAVTEALRLVSSEQHPWPRLALGHFLDRLEAGPGPDWKSVDETVRRLVMRLIAAGKTCLHLSEDAVAQELGVDREILSTLLRRELGLSVPQLRRVIVMRRAVRMLAITDEQVAQIAYATGFEHPSAFNRGFASLFGISPRTFRRLMGARSRKHT
jgi:DNA-binding response OmpR family regulator/AraC-like DNA-binding protein